MIPLIGLGLGLGGIIGKMIGRKKANREMDALLMKDPKYQKNPIAEQRLGLARTLLNARMPGAVSAEKNILSNQANQVGVVQRNATSGAQAIAATAGIGGQTNQSITDLGMVEAQDYQRRLNNLFNAEEGVIAEDDKVYSDQLRRYGNVFQAAGAKNENRQNTWGDISNLGFGLMDFGLAGGFKNLFPKKPAIQRLQPTGTYGYQGSLGDGIGNRRTPNFR